METIYQRRERLARIAPIPSKTRQAIHEQNQQALDRAIRQRGLTELRAKFREYD